MIDIIDDKNVWHVDVLDGQGVLVSRFNTGSGPDDIVEEISNLLKGLKLEHDVKVVEVK